MGEVPDHQLNELMPSDTTAGKGLCFLLGPGSPPVSLAVVQGLTAPLQARDRQAAEPGQGFPAAKSGERCCIPFIALQLIASCACPDSPASSPASALPLLRPFQEQIQLFTTVCFTRVWHMEYASLAANSSDHFITLILCQ